VDSGYARLAVAGKLRVRRGRWWGSSRDQREHAAAPVEVGFLDTPGYAEGVAGVRTLRVTSRTVMRASRD